jgi:hypothetical protein
VALSACAATPAASSSGSGSGSGSKGNSASARVLGEQRGSPDLVGQPAPAGTGELDSLSCANAEQCWATGVAGPDTSVAASVVLIATKNGGLTWQAEHLGLTATPALTGIACPSVSDCMAVGSTATGLGTGVVLTTRDGGTTWNSIAPPTGAFLVTAVACSAVGACIVIVNDGTYIWSASTTNFGATWQRQGDLPIGMEGVNDLSCVATGPCLVAGYLPSTAGHGAGAIAYSANGGATWTAATVPAGGVLSATTCTTALHCLAVGTTSTTISDVAPAKGLVLGSGDGGHTWTAEAAPPIDSVYGVSCPDALDCALVGVDWEQNTTLGSGAGAMSHDGGTTFTSARTAYTPLALTALDCPTAGICLAAGGDTVARLTLPARSVPPPPKRRSS